MRDRGIEHLSDLFNKSTEWCLRTDNGAQNGFHSLSVRQNVTNRALSRVLCFFLFIPAEADRNITDYSGNKPMDYLIHQTTVSASTYSSEYSPPNTINHHTMPRSKRVGLDEFFGGAIAAGGSLKSRRTPLERSSTLQRLRSHRKRFATTADTFAKPFVTAPAASRRASGVVGSRSMVDTTDARSVHSSGSDSSMLTASADQERLAKKAGKRANRMYQSFLFRGKAAGSKEE